MYSAGYGSALKILAHWVCVIGALLLVALPSATAAPKPDLWDFWQQSAAPVQLPVDTQFAVFLQQYRAINADGIAVIDYRRVSPKARAELKAFVSSYTHIDPRGLAKPAQFAYWVNLYNAQIIVQVLEADIPPSIRDIRPGLSGLLAGGPWQKTQVTIAGQAISFNDIEHRILRPIWRDARVHFVLNCASLGCPDIPAQPLTPLRLEAQLESAAKVFIGHARAVSLSKGSLNLSSLFDWFAGDFGSTEAQRIAYLNRYLVEPVSNYQRIRYAYDWALNAP